MKNYILFFLFLNLLPFVSDISAQPKLWEIYTSSNQPFVNVTVGQYYSDSLFIKSMDKIIILQQDSIKYLIKRNESKFGLGFLIGSVSGGIIGASGGSDGGFFPQIGKATSIVLGFIIGGVIGGIAGLAAGADTEYDFEKIDTETKRNLLRRLFPEKTD